MTLGDPLQYTLIVCGFSLIAMEALLLCEVKLIE
jgi:hypothetical protein